MIYVGYIASAARIITFAKEISISENRAIGTIGIAKNLLDEIEIVSGVKFAAADSLIELLIYSTFSANIKFYFYLYLSPFISLNICLSFIFIP